MATSNDVISTIEELETIGAKNLLTLLPWSALFWLLVTVGVLRSPVESERDRSIEAPTSRDVPVYKYDCDGYAGRVCDRDREIAA
jgi:hypothetical protein